LQYRWWLQRSSSQPIRPRRDLGARHRHKKFGRPALLGFGRAAPIREDGPLTVMIREAKVISSALADPRFDENSDDPKVTAELQQLHDLYEVQGRRASLLNDLLCARTLRT
jgi:hypothetical protein